MKQKPNGSRLEETTALLQVAMANFLQNQVLFDARMERMNDKMDQKFAEIDRRFERIESLLQQMFKELPEKVFGFGQAAAKKQPG
jgi:hypothetical protein